MRQARLHRAPQTAMLRRALAAVRMQGVCKRFGERWAVRDLDLEIGEGETFVLIGPSGCGKTTTLRMMNRLIEASEGFVEVLGQDAGALDPAELRRRVGYVIQDVGLFPHYTVRQNVGIVPELVGWPRARIAERVEALMTLVGLNPSEFGARYPRELSGGQRQRVGIARALAADPPLVLLDEPFGALDPITRESLQDEFLALSGRLGKTFVLVTHDVFEAVRLGDRVAVMRDGRLVQCATPAELVSAPADDFVRAMLGRHRRELKLMTVTLGDLAPSIALEAPSGEIHSLALAPDVSIRDALDRLDGAGLDLARVEHADGLSYLSRRALVEAALG
jgi:osmoprotectant transport system ATP-binding protein